MFVFILMKYNNVGKDKGGLRISGILVSRFLCWEIIYRYSKGVYLLKFRI